MKKIYSICENLSEILNTNISIIDFKSLKIDSSYLFSVPEIYDLSILEIEKIKENLEKEEVLLYHIDDKIEIGYLCVRESKQRFFLVLGPFLLGEINRGKELTTIKSDKFLWEFYKNLKKAKTTTLTTILTLVNNLINRDSSIKLEFNTISRRKNKRENNRISPTVIKEKTDYKILTERYIFENLIIDSIKDGNSKKANFYLKKLANSFKFGSRIPNDTLRAEKNGAFIFSGMIRKAVEDLKVPYLRIHFISSRVFSMIENAKDIVDIEKVKKEIIEEYSKLCFEHLENSSMKDIINNSLTYIDINIEKNINLQEIADYCRVSVEHLCREFKEKKGVTLKKYITDKKIKSSLKYVKNLSYSIKDIATKYDYSSTELYVQNFKKIMGVTPTKYRKLYNLNL